MPRKECSALRPVLNQNNWRSSHRTRKPNPAAGFGSFLLTQYTVLRVCDYPRHGDGSLGIRETLKGLSLVQLMHRPIDLCVPYHNCGF